MFVSGMPRSFNELLLERSLLMLDRKLAVRAGDPLIRTCK